MKAPVKRIHRVLSLAAAAVWLLQAISGMLIVLHWEIEDATIPGPRVPADIAAIARQIERLPVEAGPGWRFGSMWNSAGAPGRYDISLDHEPSGAAQSVRIAGDGTVLRRRGDGDTWRNGGWMEKLILFHHELLAGEAGSWIVGISGLLLCTNILLGLKLAWARRGGWRRALWPGRIGAAPARHYGWHRALGLWLALPLLIIAGFGTLLVFEGAVGNALGHAPAETVAPPSSRPLSVDPEAAMRVALARFPGATLVALSPPSADAPWYDVRLRQPDELRRAYGKTDVLVDARTGAVLKTHDPARADPTTAFLDALFPVHTGEAGGLAGRVLVLLTGLGLATLIVLGIRLWWLRR